MELKIMMHVNMQKVLLYMALLILAVPASSAAQMAQGEESVLCRFLQSQSNYMTGADYRAGVDIRGKRVVPADISGSFSDNSLDNRVYQNVIKIPVEIDLVRYGGLSSMFPAGTELTGDFGVIEIYKDNTVTYNGEKITDQAYAYCGMGAGEADHQAPEALPEALSESLPESLPESLSAPQDNGMKAKVIKE